MKILNLDNWCEEAEQTLTECEFTKEGINTTESQGIIANLKYKFTNTTLSNYPNLKFIASCTTGLDHIDLEYCKAKEIDIISLQGETDFLQDIYATAEHTWSLIMSLIRKVPWAFNDVKQGNWNREAWQGTELRGKTLGIVGYGRIGKQIAQYARAFGIGVLAYDPYVHEYFDKKQAFNLLLQNSDIITVHVPFNKNTYHMFNDKEFAMMKPTAYFINTSRGVIVEEGSLLTALLDKKIAGAAIDVATNEPDIWEQLRIYANTQNNLIITPHIAGNTAESRKKTQIFIANKIKEYINTEGV